MREKEVLVIIPAYNEAANIGKVLDQLERPEYPRLQMFLL